MTSPLILVAAISLLTCLGLLSFQRQHNESLRESIAQVSEENLQRLPSPQQIITLEPEVTSEERVRKAQHDIISTLNDVLQQTDSPFALLKGLPNFLQAIQDLDSHELQLLRSELKAYLKSKGKNYRQMAWIIDECLAGLAAEQSPEALLAQEKAKKGMGLNEHYGLVSLARTNPQAAIDWLNQKELPAAQLEYTQRGLVTQLLLEDSPGAVLALQAYGFPWQKREMYLNAEPFISLSEKQTLQLEQALANPAHANIRTTLAQTIVQSLFTSDISAARQKAEELELSQADLAPIFKQAIGQQHKHPEQLLEWLQATPEASQDQIGRIAYNWGMHNLETAGKWLNTQSPSKHKDYSLQGYAQAVSAVDYPTALEWLTQIQDPKLKKQSTKNMIRFWKHFDAGAAESWLLQNR